MTSQWHERKEFALSRESLTALLANDIPAIRIELFANHEECAQFAMAMRNGRLRHYGVDRPIGYIGMAQYEYRWGHDKKDYFDAVAEANADQKDVFDRSFDPMERLISTLQSVWSAPVKIAEDEYGPYFAGIIRFASEGIALHADYAPFNMPGYSVDAIDAQLGWNLFVEAPDAGGVTKIYNAPWAPEMKDDEPPQSYGLYSGDFEGVESFEYSAAVGDVVLFNSRNPHEVSAGQGVGEEGRLQIGSFVGRVSDQSLVLFS